MPLVIAEVGLNSNGSVKTAKAMIALAASLGADFIKFQKRTVDAVYKPTYLNKSRKSWWGDTVRDEKMGLEFGQDEYEQIDAYCREQGIGWFASPWDVESVLFLQKFNVPYMKVASVCLTNKPLLEAIRNSSVPVILSTAMATDEEIYEAVTFLHEHGAQCHHVLHCVAKYPAADEDMNLKRIDHLKDLVGGMSRVGFSNHYPGIRYMLQVAPHVSLIEFHMTLDKAMPGPDHKASLGPAEFADLMAYIQAGAVAQGNGRYNPTPEELGKASNYAWR